MDRVKAYWILKAEQIRIDGMWEDPEYDTIYHISCSNCNKPSPGQGQYNYCPHCGAEMRKANE